MNPAFVLDDEDKPLLAGTVDPDPESSDLLVRTCGGSYAVTTAECSPDTLREILKKLDGTRSLADIAKGSLTAIRIVQELARNGLIQVPAGPGPTGADFLLQLEDTANDLLYRTLYRNPFWRAITGNVDEVPLNVFYGLVIENYHFLYRESWFDAPALSFQGSTAARLLMNKFYAEEYGHDELLLKALNTIGLSRQDLFETVPLPATTALCNALACWARYDPLFFFSTLGVLEGKDIKIDSFVEACERRRLPKEFVAPVRVHAEINLNGGHGNLGRAMFEHLPHIDDAAATRMRRQTVLFVELYDSFYSSIWNYYSTTTSILRRVSSFDAVELDR